MVGPSHFLKYRKVEESREDKVTQINAVSLSSLYMHFTALVGLVILLHRFWLPIRSAFIQILPTTSRRPQRAVIGYQNYRPTFDDVCGRAQHACPIPIAHQ